MKKARVIYNPSSGREEAKKLLPIILDTFENMGYETSSHATMGKGDATKEAKRVSKLKFDLIVSVGGDGTVYEIINGICEKEHRPKLAILPLGTSNDFARALGLPKNVKKCLEIMKMHKTELVDIGKMNKKYFINVAGGGSLTELSYEVPSKLKTSLGQLAYYIKGAEKILTFRPYWAEIEISNQVIKEEIMLFIVANSNIVGGFDKIAPNANYTDGLFDVYFLKKSNMADLARIIPLLLRGEHVKDQKILHFKTDSFSIKPSENIQINLDGELGGMTPCEFKILKKHIEIFKK